LQCTVHGQAGVDVQRPVVVGNNNGGELVQVGRSALVQRKRKEYAIQTNAWLHITNGTHGFHAHKHAGEADASGHENVPLEKPARVRKTRVKSVVHRNVPQNNNGTNGLAGPRARSYAGVAKRCVRVIALLGRVKVLPWKRCNAIITNVQVVVERRAWEY